MQSRPSLATNHREIVAHYFGWERHVGPARQVWAKPFPTSVPERVSFLKKHGFVVLRNMLGAKELASLRRECTRFEKNYRQIPPVREAYDLEPTQDPSRKYPTFRKIGGICTLSKPFNHLMRHADLLSVLENVVGPEIYLFLDAIYPKSARVAREKPWHQDQAFWPWSPKNVIYQTMTALDDCLPENGALQVIPGTHHSFLPHTGREANIELPKEQLEKAVYVPLEAGDCILFHCLLLHASEPNRSDQDRRTVFISYRPGGMTYEGSGVRPEDVPVLPLGTER